MQNPPVEEDVALKHQNGVGRVALLGLSPESPEGRHEGTGEYVKDAPVFLMQCEDPTRTNAIPYITGARQAFGTVTWTGSSLTKGYARKSLTEHESLIGLSSFLQEAVKIPNDNDNLGEKAQSMLENLSFIGERERLEAAQGIASSWRSYLQDNPKAQLCPVVDMAEPGRPKSGPYLLDTILKNFTDDELLQWNNRLVTAPQNLTAEPEDVHVVILDDWTISGQQLAEEAALFGKEYPQYKDCIGIQLVIATEERLSGGLEIHVEDTEIGTVSDQQIPVSAYYLAHSASEAAAPVSRAHITGAHCSVDYDFENEIAAMAERLDIDMPPATNIARPYREEGIVLNQAERLHQDPVPDAPAKTYIVGSVDLNEGSVIISIDPKPVKKQIVDPEDFL